MTRCGDQRPKAQRRSTHTHTHTNPDMDGTEAKTGTRGKTKDRRENTKQQKKLNVQCQVVKPALTQKVTLISTESLD